MSKAADKIALSGNKKSSTKNGRSWQETAWIETYFQIAASAFILVGLIFKPVFYSAVIDFSFIILIISLFAYKVTLRLQVKPRINSHDYGTITFLMFKLFEIVVTIWAVVVIYGLIGKIDSRFNTQQWQYLITATLSLYAVIKVFDILAIYYVGLATSRFSAFTIRVATTIFMVAMVALSWILGVSHGKGWSVFLALSAFVVFISDAKFWSSINFLKSKAKEIRVISDKAQSISDLLKAAELYVVFSAAISEYWEGEKSKVVAWLYKFVLRAPMSRDSRGSQVFFTMMFFLLASLLALLLVNILFRFGQKSNSN